MSSSMPIMLPWGSRGPPGGLGGLSAPSVPPEGSSWCGVDERQWGPPGGPQGGPSRGAPPRLRPQRSYVRLSQSFRWSQGGVVVESHSSSAQVMCSVGPPEATAAKVSLVFVFCLNKHTSFCSSFCCLPPCLRGFRVETLSSASPVKGVAFVYSIQSMHECMRRR